MEISKTTIEYVVHFGALEGDESPRDFVLAFKSEKMDEMKMRACLTRCFGGRFFIFDKIFDSFIHTKDNPHTLIIGGEYGIRFIKTERELSEEEIKANMFIAEFIDSIA
jgi:hypothetical protein